MCKDNTTTGACVGNISTLIALMIMSLDDIGLGCLGGRIQYPVDALAWVS